MFKKTLYSTVIAILIFVILGVFLPHDVHVERHITIQRPAVTVFTVLNSYHYFMSWSPWAGRDPAAVTQISGPQRGVGAKMSWRGNPRLVGSGWQEIIESRPNSLLRMHLEFDQQGAAESYFGIEPSASGVRVTWGFDADLREGQSILGGFLAGYFALFFDHWIGADYERGLAGLKFLVESMPAADFAGLEVQMVEAEPHDILYVSTEEDGGPADLSPDLAAAYREITAFMTLNAIDRAAQPMAIMHVDGENRYELQAAIPVVSRDFETSGRIRAGHSPAGRALRVSHFGPYRDLSRSYDRLAAWMAARGIAAGSVSWEHYISDPGKTDPENLITHIYMQVADDS
jgi:effector-binding domain-containing protein